MPGKKITIKDVARLAGVGVGTVSRVLSGTGYVGEETRERVMRAIGEMNYRPDEMARNLRRGQTRTVGVILPDMANPLFARIISHTEEKLRQQGYSALLTSSFSNPTLEIELFQSLASRKVDGLVVVPCSEDDPAMTELLANWGKPVVIMDRYMLGDAPLVGHVQTDHAMGMRQAVDTLAARNHHTVMLFYLDMTRPGLERRRGFLEAVERHQGRLQAELECGHERPDSGYRVLKSRLERGPVPDGLVVGHNRMLPGVLRALRERGVEVGRDISLICCDETELTEFYSPPISVIRRDLSLIGEAAYEVFMRLNSDSSEQRCVVLPTEFVETASVRHL